MKKEVLKLGCNSVLGGTSLNSFYSYINDERLPVNRKSLRVISNNTIYNAIKFKYCIN
ncbi:MAG: hypothetical protein ABIH37_03565 [archaeon]